VTAFWLIALVMTLAASVLVLIPLWRGRPQHSLSQETVDIAIFRERLAELEAEHRQGRIDAEQYRQLRQDLERTLLTDAAPVAEQAPASSRSTPVAAAVLAIAIPLLALGYYYLSAYRGAAGEWIALQARFDTAVEQLLQDPSALPAAAQDDLPGFTRVLQAKVLKAGSQDPNNYYLLGISYLQQRQMGQALTALRQAHELDPEQPAIMLAYGQALLSVQDARLNALGRQLLRRLLAVEPDNQRALMVLGFGAFNNGEYAQAIALWRRLLTQRQPDSESAQILRSSIARAEQLLASSQQTQAAPATPAGPRIAVTVDVAPALRTQLTPQDTLFIFAKAAAGPPMPLAAVRRPARDFPVQVVLDDSQAMMPAMKLSAFENVVVSARISKAGAVAAQPGDLQAAETALNLSEGLQKVALLIDRVVE